MITALETADRQALKREVLLPVIFSKLGPGKPLITVGELKRSLPPDPRINFDLSHWVEDLVRQLHHYMYLDRKEPTEEDRELHGGKVRYVYWCIRELPTNKVAFVNSCIEPKGVNQLPPRGRIIGPDDDDEKKVPSAASHPETLPPEVAAQIAETVINSLPQMIEGLNAFNATLNRIENMLMKQEERAKQRLGIIRDRHKTPTTLPTIDIKRQGI